MIILIWILKFLWQLTSPENVNQSPLIIINNRHLAIEIFNDTPISLPDSLGKIKNPEKISKFAKNWCSFRKFATIHKILNIPSSF